MKRVARKPTKPVEPEDNPGALTVIVNKKWRLVWDGVQFQVHERMQHETGKTAGEVYWKRHAYLRHLNNAIDWLMRNEIYAQRVNIDMPALAELYARFNKLAAECKAASDRIDAALAPAPVKKAAAAPVAPVIPEERVERVQRRKPPVVVTAAKHKTNKHGMPDFLVRKPAPKSKK